MAVELNVRTQLGKIIEELRKVQEEAAKVGDSLQQGADATTDVLEKQTKRTERYFETLRGLGGRVASQLRDDFKSLLAINAISQSLKLSEQFRGTLSETISLSDSIRKLGSTLGIAQSRFASFQTKMVSGLGQIGLSSEAAANALAGLAETPVRGEENIASYARTAGQLASISREQGKEGGIAKGLSSVVVARGGNPNDQKQVDAVAQDALRIRQATGKSISEVLSAMEELFSSANADFKGRLKSGGGTSLATASLLGGKGATSFLERYMGMNRIERMGLEAQGLGKLIGQDGQLNPKAFDSTMREAKGRGLGDAQAGLKTFGFSDEEAKGFMRLADAIKTNGDVIERARTSVVDINKAYRDGMGMGEAFRASLNRVKGFLAEPLSAISQGGTDLLGKASGSALGSAAVVGGGGILAAVLAGGGLRGIGKALGGGVGGMAKGAAIEAATGRQVQPVYVVNAKEIGGGGFGDAIAASAGMGTLARAGSIVGKAAGVVGLGMGAYEAGSALGNAIDKTEIGGKVFDRLADIMLVLSQKIGAMPKESKIDVWTQTPNLKASVKPSRGSSNGP